MSVARAPDDVEAHLASRERRARLGVVVVAAASAAVGLVGWSLGPCCWLLVRPYVWLGGALLLAWAVLIGIASLALVLAAFRLRRCLAVDPAQIPRELIRTAFAAAAAGLPALLWWPYLLWFVARGNGFWVFEGWSIFGTALASIPAIPGALALGLCAWHRRIYATLPPSGLHPAPGPRRAVLLVMALAALLAFGWPGGPRATGHSATLDGENVDELTRLWLAGDHSAEAPLLALGEPAAAAVAAQLPGAGRGVRVEVARWLGDVFQVAAKVAPGFDRFRIDAQYEPEVLRLFDWFGVAGLGVAPDVARYRITDLAAHAADPAWRARTGPLPTGPVPATQLGAAFDAVTRMHRAGMPPLSAEALAPLWDLMRDGDARIRVLAARAYGRWAPPERAVDAVPVLRAELDNDADLGTQRLAILGATWIGEAGRALAPDVARVGIAAHDRQWRGEVRFAPLPPTAPPYGGAPALARLRRAPPAFGRPRPSGAPARAPLRSDVRLFDTCVSTVGLIGAGAPAELDLIGRALAAGNPQRRRVGLMAAENLGPAGAPLLPRIRVLLGDPTDGSPLMAVRLQAIRACISIERSTASVVGAVQSALADPGLGPEQIGSVLAALGWLGPQGTDAIPVLEAYRARVAGTPREADVVRALDQIRHGPGPK